MKLELFAVFDSKAGVFTPPFTAPNRTVALRYFKGTVDDKETTMGKFPEDFSLAFIGYYEDMNGIVDPAGPEIVANGTHLVDRDKVN